MSLLHADNGNTYGTGLGTGIGGWSAAQLRALEGVYVEFTQTNNGLFADPDPTSNGGSVFYFSAGAGARYDFYMPVLRKVLPAAKTTVGMSARMWWAGFAADNENGPMMRFADSGNVTNIWLQVTNIGSIRAYRGIFNNAEPTLLGESSVCLTASAWHHIEAKVLFNAATGTLEIRVNGQVVLLLGPINTVYSAANCQNVCLSKRCSGTANGGGVYWKDWVVWDTAGTVNNDFFGTCQVGYFPVDSDVALNWTPSSGALGYPMMDEYGPPNDADYTSATVAQTNTSEYGVPSLPADVTSVRGMMLMARAQKSDGGDCQIQAGIKSSGNVALGTDRPITTAFTYWMDIFELDPHTGAPLTPIAFNAMTVTTDRTL